MVDNAVSHADQMAQFTRAVEDADGCLASLSPDRHGELVVLRER